MTITDKDIMQYESDIWAAADLLIAAGIKQSKFPDYMMPFFALIMLESRMKREVIKLEEEEGLTREDNLDDFIEAFLDLNCGYNEFIVRNDKTLANICRNDKTFEQDFKKYLLGFDNEIKRLLGVERGTDESKFLNITGVCAELRKKGILMKTVTKWAEIDFTPFNNSEITTLEEHIKRKWADISAETAGEQYTPNDIISLIAEIVGEKIQMPHNRYVSIYDPTCGGGNLLYGVADRLKNEYKYDFIKTCGCDISDALYALACIESRFREDAVIKYGNTLTSVPFRGTEFDVVIANPPYGVSWKGYEKEIRNDQTGQFHAQPSISDGQLLFMQHILYHLNDTGIAVEVHNGSTLFSGDAGGGESNIRKYVFDQDWVEAIIQMPSDEFFNTGIYTYLWIMNKNKPAKRKDKVILINGSNGWQQLKKSKGSKRREMLPEHRQQIVDALKNFEDCDIAKVFPKWHFYYNKQAITLTNVSDNGQTVLDSLIKDGNSYKLKPDSIYVNGQVVNKLTFNNEEVAQQAFTLINGVDYKKEDVRFRKKDGSEYYFDKETNSIILKDVKGVCHDYGCGKFVVKLSKLKKAGTATISVEITPEYVNDYEIIPYAPKEEENRKNIADFMAKYISKPFYYRDNTVGVELNFNKEFYVFEKIEAVDDILDELRTLDEKLKTLEEEIGL